MKIMRAMISNNSIKCNSAIQLKKGDTGTDVEIERLIDEIEQIAEEPAHNTILYNDDYHVFEDVVHMVRVATGKSIMDAYAITLEAHNNDRAVCYSGEKKDCEKVAQTLRNAGLIVEVD